MTLEQWTFWKGWTRTDDFRGQCNAHNLVPLDVSRMCNEHDERIQVASIRLGTHPDMRFINLVLAKYAQVYNH